MPDNETAGPDELTWQRLMEVLIGGALRGMIQTYDYVDNHMGGTLPVLSEVDLHDAAVLLAATILENSPACENASSFGSAATMVRRNVLAHLKTCRAERDASGEAMLDKLLEQAGIEKVWHH